MPASAFVCEWSVSLSVAPRDQIRKAAWFMLLHFDREALLIVRFASVNLSQNTFKVHVNNVGVFHLFVIVCEDQLVLSLFRHLRSGRLFSSPLHSGLCFSRRSLVVYLCRQRLQKCLLSLCLV